MASKAKQLCSFTFVFMLMILGVLIAFHQDTFTTFDNFRGTFLVNSATPYNLRKVSSIDNYFLNYSLKLSSDFLDYFDDTLDGVVCNSTHSMSSVKYSKIVLDHFENGTATVTIVTYNQRNLRKSIGGDVILVWATQIDGDGRSPGTVVDNMDGSYKGHVGIYWQGRTSISAKIASSAENTCLRYNSLKRFGNTVFAMKHPWGILGLYRNGLHQETTRCGPNPFLYGYERICNFTSLNDNNSWFCGAPKKAVLDCNRIYSFKTGRFDLPAQDTDMNGKIKQPGHGMLSEIFMVNSEIHSHRQQEMVCKFVPKRVSWRKLSPLGFWINNSWREKSQCSRHFEPTNDKYRTCLNGKVLALFGDSTIRQYIEYIGKNVLDLGPIDLKSDYGPNRSYHSYRIFKKHNVSILYRKHELPFHNPDVRPIGVKSVPHLLRDLSLSLIPDHSLVIVLNYFSHFQAYPPSEYRIRLAKLATAVKQLLARKPRAAVFIKGPHVCIDDTRWFDAKFSLLYRDILFEEFNDLMDSVIYLDTWSITVAHNSELLHPEGKSMQSQIDQLMWYLCD